MQLEIPFNYHANVVPLRCKVSRWLEFHAAEPFRIDIEEHTEEEAPIAFRVEQNAYNSERYIVRLHNEKLYSPVKYRERGEWFEVHIDSLEVYLYNQTVLKVGRQTKDGQAAPTPVLRQYEVREIITHEEAHAREKITNFFSKSDLIIVNGIIHEKSEEPRWVVRGGWPYDAGTKIIAMREWNHIIPMEAYFRADEYHRIGELLEKRDPKNTRYYTDDTIEVLISEAIKLDMPKEIKNMRIEDNQRRYISIGEQIKSMQEHIDQYISQRKNVLAELTADGAQPVEA